jgi:hypothetical protein
MIGRLLCALGRHSTAWTDGRGYLTWTTCRRCDAASFRKGFGGRPVHKGRLILLVLVVLTFLAGFLTHSVLAASRSPQQLGSARSGPASESPIAVAAASPEPRGWSDASIAPGVSVGEGGVPTPAKPSPAGRWHLIYVTFYGGSDHLDDGTHHFADGAVFLPGTWAIASGPDIRLGTWLELRWTDPHGVLHSETAEVRDRHGRGTAPFLDLTVALSAALFGVAGNHIVEWRRVP